VQATVTCHARPEKTSAPSQHSAPSTGFAVSPALSAPSAYAGAPKKRFKPRAFRAAAGGSPTLATFTNGRSPIRPRSSDRVRTPFTASRQAAVRS
jgi:hypothetical protein